MSLFWKTASWVLPYRVFNFLQDKRTRQIEAANFERRFGHLQRLALPNAALKDRHKGARAFLLGNGPSTLQQDLSRLAHEIVFSVSSGYLHPQYDVIKPRYHCVPQITYGRMTEQDVIAWFQEMHRRIGDAEIFLSASEEKLVRDHGLFPGRAVHYVFLHENFDHLQSRDIPDLSGIIPAVQSVPIMGAMIALFMGARDIYLLGTDHSDIRTGVYRYAFEPTVLKGKDSTVDETGKLLTTRYDDFHAFARLWRQYRVTREIAEANGAHLWNATAGGDLDEVPRVHLEQVLG